MNHWVMCERLRQHRLADAAHAYQCGERKRSPVVVPEERIAQSR
jgi:hypothetical protein